MTRLIANLCLISCLLIVAVCVAASLFEWLADRADERSGQKPKSNAASGEASSGNAAGKDHCEKVP